MAIIVVGFFLRVYRLGDRSVWWDEGYTGWIAREPLGAIAMISAHDVHPPLFYWLLTGWRLISGDSEFGLRLFSVFIGLLTLAAVYRLGQASRGSWVALLAALFLAINRFHIIWSQEIRMYILAAFWATLALWATVQYWKRPSVRYGLLYVIFMAGGLYTLYLFALLLAVTNAAALWWIWRSESRLRALAGWTALQIGVLLVYLPWILYALDRIRTASTASSFRFLEFLEIYWTMLTMGIPVAVERYWVYTIPVLALAILSTLYLARRVRGQSVHESIFLLLFLGVTLPAAAVYLISLPRDTFFYAPQIAPRYLIIVIAAYVVLLAYGLWELSRRWRLAASLAALVVVVVGLIGLRSYHPGRIIHDDYQSLVATIEAYRRPEDVVILFTDRDWPIFAFHYEGQWTGIPASWQITPKTAENTLSGLWQDHQGIWLVSTPNAAQADPQGLLAGWLESRAAATASYEFGDKRLDFYARDQDRAATIDQIVDSSFARPIHIVSPEGLELFAYDVPVPEYESGDTVALALYWQGQGQETVTAGIMDEEQRPLQSKMESISLVGAPLRQQLNLVVPPDAPSGDYSLFVRFSSGPSIPFGDISVRQRQRTILGVGDVEIQQPTPYTFANGLRLLGYDLAEREVQAGESVPLTLYWQTDRQQEERYKVFTHIQGTTFNNEGNLLWGQQDNEPANGTRPLPQWRIGEVIVDRYSIPVNEQAPPGEYALIVGLYHPVSGERLLLSDDAGEQADHATLTTLSVVAPE